MPKILTHLSAPNQKLPALSVRHYCPILSSDGVAFIADYGCGKLRNLAVFKKYFNEVILVDQKIIIEKNQETIKPSNSCQLMTVEEFSKSEQRFDAIFLISVLHTIPYKAARKRVIKECSDKLKIGGYLIVDVPQSETYYNRRREKKYRDGYLMSQGKVSYTFYKSFYAEELDNFLTKGTGFKIIDSTYQCKHIIRRLQKVR